jgi:hypothetical protein
VPQATGARPGGALGWLNLTVKFLLELCALAAFGYAATHVGHGVAVTVLATVAAPLAAAVAWGLLAAPRARRRLPMPARAVFEPGVFALAAILLAVVHQVGLAIALAVVAALNAVALTLLRQWER